MIGTDNTNSNGYQQFSEYFLVKHASFTHAVIEKSKISEVGSIIRIHPTKFPLSEKKVKF